MRATIRQVRELLPHLEEALQEAGQIVVTRRGQAIARLVPLQVMGDAARLLGLRLLHFGASEALPGMDGGPRHRV